MTHLTALTAGQQIPYGGDKVAFVSQQLADRFTAGDRIVVVQHDGTLLHIPASDFVEADAAVSDALNAFHLLADCTDEQITAFFGGFAERLADDAAFSTIAEANAADVASAAERGRSTTRLVLSAKMRADMIAGLHTWRELPTRRSQRVQRFEHDGWAVESWRAPLGVVGFVFEGRPNVFADATGVLRTGNTVVFRIGSDALGTARAIVRSCVAPALADSGLPAGAVRLLDSAAHAAGWALFGDPRLGLAVARGSGPAVAQLGAVARQSGVPVSLHGTGGAWVMATESAAPEALRLAVRHSLDRKVCNTMNVCVLVGQASRYEDVVRSAAPVGSVVHAADSGSDLGHEFEWETNPEFWLVHCDTLDNAIELFNRHSPRFAASLISDDTAEHEVLYQRIDAPFVGNGFTRWVDGQFALDQPELGLSNWQGGRLLARGGVLSGDSVHTVRLRATVVDHELHR